MTLERSAITLAAGVIVSLLAALLASVSPATAASSIDRFSLAIAFDGTAPFDAAPGPGADVSSTNGIVRSGDYVIYRWDYEVRTPGDLTITHTLATGNAWQQDSTSICAEGAAAIDASKRILTCTLSGIAAGVGSATVKARVGSHANGTVLVSSATAAGLSATSPSVTISARVDPSINLAMYSAVDPGFGPGPGALSGQTGYRIRNALDMWMPVQAGRPDHGNQGILSPITFVVNPPVEYPSSSLVTCGNRPVVGTQPFASGNPINSVANGGSISCSQSAAGQPVTVTITGTDTSLLTWPTLNRSGGALDSSRGYVFVGSIDFWIPVSSWPSGSVSTITTQASEFDPIGDSGATNYGSGYQPGFAPGASCDTSLGNCTLRTVDNTTPVLKTLNLQSQFRAAGSFDPLPGGTSRTSGDGPWFRGQSGEWVFSFIQQANSVAQTSVTGCIKWDPALHQISSVGASPTHPSLMPYAIEYGSISYADDTARKNGQCGVAGDGQVGWHSSITAAGGPGAVTAVRLTQTAPMLAGQGMSIVMRTTRTALDLPVSTPIPAFMSAQSDQLGFIASSYNASTHASSSTGQRGLAADVRTTLSSAWVPSTNASPGSVRQLTVNATVSNPHEFTSRTARGVSVSVVLPTACMRFVPGSGSLAPTSVTAANFGADGVPCSGDDGVGQTLTFSLGDLTPSTVSGSGLSTTVPITFNVDLNFGIASPAPYGAVSTVAASNGFAILAARQATATLNVVSLTGFSISKSADRSTLYPGQPVTYTVSWINPTASSIGRASVVDLLPFEGDARTSADFGSLTVGDVSLIVGSGFSSDVTIEYSETPSATISSALATDASGDTGIVWSTSRPSGTITGIRFVIDELAANERGSATIHITPSNVIKTSVLGNSVWGRAAQVATPLNSQGLSVLPSALTSVSGSVYLDNNYSWSKDTGDSALHNRTVVANGYDFGPNGIDDAGAGDDVVLTTAATAVSDSAGAYLFDNFLPGRYTFSTNAPSGLVPAEVPISPLEVTVSAAASNVNFGFQTSLAAPLPFDDLVYTAMNTPVTIAVLNNDTVAGGSGTVSSVGMPATGTATIQSNSVLFTPSPGMTGTVTFAYTVSNLARQSASANIRVIVVAAPVARQDAAATTPGSAVTVDALANDSGVNITISAVGSFSGGSATVVNNKVVVTTNSSSTGLLTIPYTIRDAAGQTASANILVTLSGDPVSPEPEPRSPHSSPASASSEVLARTGSSTLPFGAIFALGLLGAGTFLIVRRRVKRSS